MNKLSELTILVLIPILSSALLSVETPSEGILMHSALQQPGQFTDSALYLLLFLVVFGFSLIGKRIKEFRF